MALMRGPTMACTGRGYRRSKSAAIRAFRVSCSEGPKSAPARRLTQCVSWPIFCSSWHLDEMYFLSKRGIWGNNQLVVENAPNIYTDGSSTKSPRPEKKIVGALCQASLLAPTCRTALKAYLSHPGHAPIKSSRSSSQLLVQSARSRSRRERPFLSANALQA